MRRTSCAGQSDLDRRTRTRRPRSATVCGEHARDVTRKLQRALQLRNALDLEREGHTRLMLARLRVHRRDVDLLARQELRDVAQQSLPIARLDDDVDREQLIARRTPVASISRSGSRARIRPTFAHAAR